mmetsp:Transcript_1613/g.7134  ORF Transcript_1613/g.7134 Transcript_1613/m.7134 type:complete len:244 (+) Transcript_1613:2057-2788(+)
MDARPRHRVRRRTNRREKSAHPALLAERVTPSPSDPRATPGTCAATAPPRREVPSRSGTAWRSEAGTYGAIRPFRLPRRAKIAASRASPSPTAAGGSSSRMPACAGSRGGGRGSPRRTRAARGRTCGPAGTLARARLRERRRISRSRRRREIGRRRRRRGVRGDGSRGGVARRGPRSFVASTSATPWRGSRGGRRRPWPLAAGSAATSSSWCRRWRGRGSTTSPGPSTRRSRRRGEGSTASTG